RWRSGGFRAARLLLCRLAWTPPPGVFPGCGSALAVGLRTPVHLLICFWRYFRWLTFRLDLTGLSRASLMLLEAESMKLSRSRVVSRYPPPSSSSSWWDAPPTLRSRTQSLSRSNLQASPPSLFLVHSQG
uniref:Uncharacterized protein n=1 Tax=Gadus morhua TaxID=8049 RepID=A0A8C4YXP8_GADMO